jgi:hypothetical protein
MIRDEDLLLHHYGEGLAPAERERIDVALAADALLVQRKRRLLADLEAIGSQSRATASAQAHARWRAALAAAADETRSTGRKPDVHRWRFAPALAVAAAMVIGVVIGTRWPSVPAEVSPPLSETVIAANDTVPNFRRGLQLHFAETERLLVDVADADVATRERLLADVIEQNRLFARAADRAGEDKLARVLRAFDALLLAMADESLDADALKMQEQRLDFELSVMQTKLAQAASKPTLQL